MRRQYLPVAVTPQLVLLPRPQLVNVDLNGVAGQLGAGVGQTVPAGQGHMLGHGPVLLDLHVAAAQAVYHHRSRVLGEH